MLKILPTVLVRRLQVIQLLVQIRDIGLDLLRLLGNSCLYIRLRCRNEPVRPVSALNLRATVWRNVHLAYAFVHIGTLRQCIQLAGGQLQHSILAVLRRDLGFDDADLLLGEGGLLLDFLKELYIMVSVNDHR